MPIFAKINLHARCKPSSFLPVPDSCFFILFYFLLHGPNSCALIGILRSGLVGVGWLFRTFFMCLDHRFCQMG